MFTWYLWFLSLAMSFHKVLKMSLALKIDYTTISCALHWYTSIWLVWINDVSPITFLIESFLTCFTFIWLFSRLIFCHMIFFPNFLLHMLHSNFLLQDFWCVRDVMKHFKLNWVVFGLTSAQSFWGMHCPFRWGACNLSTKITFVFNMSTMHESVARWKFQYEQITCDMCDVNLQCFCLIYFVSRGDISHNEIIRLLWTFWCGISFYFMAWNIYQFDHISNFQTYVNPRWSFLSLWMFLLKM